MAKIILLTALVLFASAFNLAQNVADPIACVEEKCPTEWDACQKDSKCLPAIQDCQKKCGTSSSCWTFCLPTKGSQAAINLAKCAQKQGCLGMEPIEINALAVFTPQECVEQHCSSQADACKKDLRCLAVLQDCEKQCQKDQSCWSTCLAKKGNSHANALWKCILDNNCLNQLSIDVADPIACVEEKCPTEWDACQKDSKCLPAIQDCQKKCGTSSSCWTFCLPTKGSQAAINLAKCAQKQGCLGMQNPFAECMSKSCVSQQTQCLYNRQCSENIHKCLSSSDFNFDLECLSKESKNSGILASWYECAGSSFCL